MEEGILLIFGTLLTIAFYLAFFLLIRKLVLWYFRVDQAVNALEGLYELQLLLHAQEIKETKLFFKNKSNQQLIEMSIADYLKKDNKHNYKIQ